MNFYFLTPVDILGGTNHCLPRQKDALDNERDVSLSCYCRIVVVPSRTPFLLSV